MSKKLLHAVVLFGLASVSEAQDQAIERTTRIEPANLGFPENALTAPEDLSQNSVAGFAAEVILTSDVDWAAKWNSPTYSVPTFTVAREAHDGDTIHLAIFFYNPALDADGKDHLTCDIEILQPDGVVSLSRKATPCSQPLPYGPRQVYMAPIDIDYIADPKDMRGEWVVKATVHDNVRDVSLPLQTSLVVK